MKILAAVTIASLFFTACKKEKTDILHLMDGQWKLVTISDKTTGNTYFRPVGSSGDITIRFSGESFEGRTLRNSLSNGSFTLFDDSQLLFRNYSSTGVQEDDWGNMFLTVLAVCPTESLMLCQASRFAFEGNKLIIRSPLRYDLTLVRN